MKDFVGMMLTQRLSALAHDLAKQCQVTGQSKPISEDRQKTNKKKFNNVLESAGSSGQSKFF